MKVGLINFHFSNNFGAILQCLALKKYITKKGNEVIVVDYQPEYIVQQQSPFPNPITYGSWAAHEYENASLINKWFHIFKRSAHAIYQWKDAIKSKKRNSVFKKYMQRTLVLSKTYKTYKDLESNPPICDVYISGSDQVWNPKVTRADLDEAYFLRFAPNGKKRIAYAVSPCQLDVDKYQHKLKTYLADYDMISLREKELLTELKEVSGKDMCVCIDPTLLLKAEDYEEYEIVPVDIPEEYILVYGFKDGNRPKLLGQIADYISQKTKLPIIDISLEQVYVPKYARAKKTVSPGEFLGYIKKATYVITNSFHGTAFSIIFHKNLWSLEKAVTASRVRELMTVAGLEDRLISKFDVQKIEKGLSNNIDYGQVEEKIGTLVKSSKDYLDRALEK